MKPAVDPAATKPEQDGSPQFHGDLPFTLKELKEAIPKHCFERPLLQSFLHLFSDIIQLVAYTMAYYFFSNLLTAFFYGNDAPSSLAMDGVYYLLQTILFVVYLFIESVTMTGLWVLQHECGHYAFADSPLVCDIVGYIVGTALLVPYFAWQKSHAIHHSATNHMERDQTWVPQNIQEPNEKEKEKTESVLAVFKDMLVMGTVGWPLHLLINVSGPIKENILAFYMGVRYQPAAIDGCDEPKKNHTVTFTSHFYPGSPIFTKSEAWKIHLSNIGIVVMLVILYNLFQVFGWQFMTTVYVLPLCGNFFFLTTITFLQHIDDNLPHMDEGEWTWLKGAICTIDRHMGSSILDSKFHHIHDTHVCHHLFSKIPFYHAQEATEAIKKVLGKYYRDETEKNFFVSLYENLKTCIVLKRDPKHAGLLWWDH